MKSSRRWLIASPDKVPHYIDGTKRWGQLDSPEDITRLANYDEAKAALATYGAGWHLGFALGPDGEGGNWQGIDFDKIEDNLIAGFVDALPGYVERSPSGKGVHAIGYGRSFRALGSNDSGVEAYAAGRYFTVTENLIRDSASTCLADHVESVLAPMHRAASRHAPNAVAEHHVATVQVSPQTVTDLRSALNFLRADDRDLWIAMGHALKELGEVGRELWFTWSQTSEKFDGLDAARVWDSLLPKNTGYQAVFAEAQRRGWVNPASNTAKLDNAEMAREISARPFAAPAVTDIPPRPWVLGRWLLRRTVATVIAPGGTGKSALMVAAALSLASGRELLGKTVWGGPKRVWLWNLEDDRDELARQIIACSQHHGLSEQDYAGRLFVNDAKSPLCTATKGREGLTIHEPVNAALVAEIHARKIDVLIIDPFVSSHRAEENDNGQINAIAERWANIARETNCSIILVHHSRKLGGQQVDAEAARGASALGNASRSVIVLNRMEKPEATRFGVSDEDRRRYIRVSNDKTNRAPAGEADWYRLIPVRLANGGPEGGDSVGVIERWTPTEISAIFDDTARARIQAEIVSGEWRAQHTAKDWAGRAVAQVLGLDVSNPANKVRVIALLKDMLAKGQLRIENRPDANRKKRDFIIAGEPIVPVCDSPAW